MKRSSLILSAALVSSALAAGCAHVGSADSSRKPVTVTRNEADVQGCQMITKVRVAGAAANEVQTRLEDMTRSRDGNVLLLTEGEPTAGIAYRCTGFPTPSGGR